MSLTTIFMIFAIIMFFIIPSLKPQTISIKRLIIVPAIFLYLLSDSLTSHFHLQIVDYFVVGLGMIMGLSTGIMVRRNTRTQINSGAGTIAIPGSYFNLVIFVLIFSLQFLIGYLHATDKSFFLTGSFARDALLFCLSFTSTLSAGGNLVWLNRYRVAQRNKMINFD